MCLCSEPAWRLGSFLLWKCKAGKEQITSPDIFICCTISASYMSSLTLFLLSLFAFKTQLFLPCQHPLLLPPFSSSTFVSFPSVLLFCVSYSLFLSVPPLYIPVSPVSPSSSFSHIVLLSFSPSFYSVI